MKYLLNELIDVMGAPSRVPSLDRNGGGCQEGFL